jgi:hypothetical protein
MRSSLALVVALALTACSSSGPSNLPDASGDDASVDTGAPSDGGGAGDAGPSDAIAPTDAAGDATAAFTLTSSAFAEGGVIPVANSCKGVNESPPLAWSGAPGATQSFAITLTDKSNSLVHSAIFDISSGTSSVAAGIAKVANPPTPAGSKQVKAYDNTTFGYLGPCPGTTHTYTFTLYALDVAALPNVTTASTRAQVVTELGKHTIATATLTGTFTP